MWLRNLERETESLLIAAQNNAIRINHKKARIDKMQPNGRSRLCWDWDETLNYIISECSKLAPKENKTRHDWVGKVINWELKLNHANKWCEHTPPSVLENETHKLLWDFDRLTNHLISAR